MRSRLSPEVAAAVLAMVRDGRTLDEIAARVEVDRRQADAPGGGGDQVVHRLPDRRLAALGGEQPSIAAGDRSGIR